MAVYIADWHNHIRYANDSPYTLTLRMWEYHPQYSSSSIKSCPEVTVNTL